MKLRRARKETSLLLPSHIGVARKSWHHPVVRLKQRRQMSSSMILISETSAIAALWYGTAITLWWADPILIEVVKVP